MKAKIYECYCEKTKQAQFTNDNFSLLVACKKRPTIARLERVLKDKLCGYHICYITDDICVELTATNIIGVEL